MRRPSRRHAVILSSVQTNPCEPSPPIPPLTRLDFSNAQEFANLAPMHPRHLSLALALTSSIALAQSFTPIREQKNLSPAAIAKLHTLEMLNSLPVGEWHFHAGDVPHGESPSLDDSSWPLAKPRSKAPNDAVWYRRVIEVPKTLNGYDITDSRIWFQFRAEATNALNWVSVGNPTTSLSSGNDAKITGAQGTQRVIQLGGRLTF